MTLDKATIKAVLEEVFEERSRIDSEAHNVHHQWIQCRIEAEEALRDARKARKEMYKELTKIIMQWSIPALLTGTLYWLQTGQWPTPQ
jgi:hypothetical protein